MSDTPVSNIDVAYAWGGIVAAVVAGFVARLLGRKAEPARQHTDPLAPSPAAAVGAAVGSVLPAAFTTGTDFLKLLGEIKQTLVNIDETLTSVMSHLALIEKERADREQTQQFHELNAQIAELKRNGVDQILEAIRREIKS